MPPRPVRSQGMFCKRDRFTSPSARKYELPCLLQAGQGSLASTEKSVHGRVSSNLSSIVYKMTQQKQQMEEALHSHAHEHKSKTAP